MMTKERELLKARDIFDQMCEFIQGAGKKGLRVDEVERSLFRQALALCLALLKAFVRSQGDGDEGKRIEKNGTTLCRFQKKHSRRYVSIFGELSFKRYVYGTREGQRIERVALDAKLGMPAGEFSYVLEEWQQKLVVRDPFGEAIESLHDWLGIKLGVRTTEAMNRRMSEFVDRFRAQQPPPLAEEEAEIVVVTADGKGVPMRRPLEERIKELKASKPKDPRGRKPKKRPPDGVEKPKRKRVGKGEKRTKKQMAYVGAVYSIGCHIRTPDDILEEVNRHDCNADRPKPQHKRVRAQMTQIREGEVFHALPRLFLDLAVECEQRNEGCEKPLVCLMDGQKSLWEMQKKWFERAVGILDLYHVLERLWKAAHVFHAESSPEAQDFVDHRLGMLLEGKVGYVIGGFKRLLRQHRLTGNKKKTLSSVIQYYENNRQYMRYDEYLAAGYPIGSGVVEGACRHLVKDRMERTGMRWEIQGAQSMLDLRSIYLNGDWSKFVEFRIQREQEQLYRKAA